MATKDESNSIEGAHKEGQENRPESFRRRKTEERGNLHLRELDRKPTPREERAPGSAKAERPSGCTIRPPGFEKIEKSSSSLAATHAVSNAVTELYWRRSSACKIDLSTELERALPIMGPGGEKMYILGAEFAITAIVAAVAIARRRADLSSATLPSVSKLKSEAEKEQHFSMVKIILEDCGSITASGAETDAKEESAIASGSENNSYLYSSSTSRPTVTITLSDTLVSIAQRQYHDGNVGWLIADLNQIKLKESLDGNKRVVEVADGESLELPIWKEIVSFYQRKPAGACAENLITIVTRRNVDREIVDAVLSPIVDPRES
jgi:hypothetical protein